MTCLLARITPEPTKVSKSRPEMAFTLIGEPASVPFLPALYAIWFNVKPVSEDLAAGTDEQALPLASTIKA